MLSQKNWLSIGSALSLVFCLGFLSNRLCLVITVLGVVSLLCPWFSV